MKKFTRFFVLAMVPMLMLLANVNAQYKPSSPTFGSDIPLFEYGDCTLASSHVYVANNGWIYVLTMLEASGSNYMAWRVFYSTDNGITFNVLCQWEYNTQDYILKDCDIVVTGEDATDIRLWIAEVTNSGTVNPNNAYVRINEFDAAGNWVATPFYLDYGAAPNETYSVSLATDYRSPGFGYTPWAIAVAYTGHYGMNDWLSYNFSLNGGVSFNGTDLFSQPGPNALGRTSLSLGSTLSHGWGRAAIAFEMNMAGGLGDIGLISSYTDFSVSAWVTPVAVNTAFAPSTGLCRYPTVRLMGNTGLDPTLAGYIPMIVAYEDYSSGLTNCDIMYNSLTAAYADLTQPTLSDFVIHWVGAGNGSSETTPNLSYDKAYNNFLLTYASDLGNQLIYKFTGIDNVVPGGWADLGNYRDRSDPMPWPVQPKVDINPVLAMVCFSWTEETGLPGIYNILFDAEWSTVGINDPAGKTAGNSFTLSPNPAKEYVRVMTGKPGEYTVTVTSLLGQQVMNTTFNGTVCTLQLEDLTTGVYMVRVTGNGITSAQKLSVN
jgi:hypothetical protein